MKKTLSQLLSDVRPVCKLDDTDTEYDALLTNFINDTIGDIYNTMKQPSKLMLPIINGSVTVDEGYNIVKIEPELNVNDKVIGRTIFTTLTGSLNVYVSEESPTLSKDTDFIDLQDYMIRLIPYNVAFLWYSFKKNIQVASNWYNIYNSEKQKRFKPVEIKEVYQIDLPLADFFN